MPRCRAFKLLVATVTVRWRPTHIGAAAAGGHGHSDLTAGLATLGPGRTKIVKFRRRGGDGEAI